MQQFDLLPRDEKYQQIKLHIHIKLKSLSLPPYLKGSNPIK